MRRGLALLGMAVALAVSSALTGCAHSGDGASRKADYVSALALPAVGPLQHQATGLYGKPVVAVFFATWCFPCLGQLGLFAELQREHADKGLEVVAVGMDLEGEQVLEPFARQGDYPFPILVAGERIRTGSTPFGPVTQLPSTVILDRSGEVVAAWPGLANVEEIRAAVKKAVE